MPLTLLCRAQHSRLLVHTNICPIMPYSMKLPWQRLRPCCHAYDRADAEKDYGKHIKQADTWANRLLDDSLKFINGVTDIGEWLEETHVAAAMLTCLADYMPGIIDHAWVHDRLLALVPSEVHARFKATKRTARTLEILFALARQAFQTCRAHHYSHCAHIRSHV